MSAVVVVFAAAAAADVGALIENARMQMLFVCCDAIFENVSRERESVRSFDVDGGQKRRNNNSSQLFLISRMTTFLYVHAISHSLNSSSVDASASIVLLLTSALWPLVRSSSPTNSSR